MKKRICIITGTRAEYGLLKPLIEKVYRSPMSQLQLAVTGAHLSPEFGLTYREIEEDNYPIDAKVEMLLSSDTAVGITKSMAVAQMGFADYFENHRPDIVVILGDRYEMLAAAVAAMIARIPIAHIHGGETTEGAVDEAIRHSITKMSQLHFTATEEYRRRVIQLGEQPDTVYHTGALCVENIRNIRLLSKEALEKAIGFTFADPTIMITYHPVTLENCTAEAQFSNILEVLERHKEIKVIFTKANADTDGRIINRMIDEYAAANAVRCAAYTSLGQVKYLSALQFCAAVMGNSSSGISEVPCFAIPTIDIGDRQKGRTCAASVIHCGNSIEAIETALKKSLSAAYRKSIINVKNPYEKEGTSAAIFKTICESLDQGIDLKKEFYNIASGGLDK